MKRIFIRDIENQSKEKLKLKGWVHKITQLGNIGFVLLRDKTGVMQLVIEDKELLKKLRLEMAIEVIGKVFKNRKAINNIEMKVENLNIISNVNYDMLPFQINKRKINAGLETQLDYRTVSLRRPSIRAVFKIQEEIVQAFRDFFRNEDFSEIHTPKIIASGTYDELVNENYKFRKLADLSS